MTRRRAFSLLLAALVGVFVLGSAIGILVTRARLLGDVDDRLRSNVEVLADLTAAFPLELEDFAADRNNARGVILVGPDGTIEFERAPGPESEELGRPDITVDEIVALDVGEIVTVPGIGVSHNFRVVVDELDDGSRLALAQPLNQLRSALQLLNRVLLATLFGVVGVLGLMFWWLTRVTLGRYDEIVQTADAIVEGDLDRRISSDQSDPDVAHLVGSINHMLDQNQESLAARAEAEERVTRFAAEASHELRTPLATIAGYSEVYLSGASTDPESVHKQMTRINSEATRLGRLVESMLTITRLDNEVEFESTKVDLVEVARAAVAETAFGSTDPEAAGRFSIDADDVESLVVDGDQDALYQVFANLLTNALVHAPAAEVVVTLSAADDYGVITVVDDGPGMPEHVAENVFDRFYRGSPTSESGDRTTGLGLSIAAGIVKAHGGSIDLETAQGQGTTFTVRLPLGASKASGSA